ncbi:MAG TPA: FadR family transcriptional regulator [Clostridiaceae bacterium]|nr:FadR family transcriptional regulator [Clostridiaceae bacterium]
MAGEPQLNQYITSFASNYLSPHDDSLMSKLLRLIDQEDYNVGDKLPTERELARIFGTNRNTLRESLKALEAINVLEIRHGSGIFVKRRYKLSSKNDLVLWVVMHKDEIDDFYDIREALETKAIDLMTTSMIDVANELQICLDKLDVYNCQAEDFMRHDEEFHEILRRPSNNRALCSLADTIMNIVHYERRLIALDDVRRIRSFKEHMAIKAAMETENKQFVKDVLIAHFSSVKEELHTLLPQG